ncbi:hypothetical protein OROHE_013924 [Orobanche hederae]
MAFCRSSLLLRKALGGSHHAAATCSSAYACGWPAESKGSRWYSDGEGTTISAPGYHVNTAPSHMTGQLMVEHGPLTETKFIKRSPVGSKVIGAFIMPSEIVSTAQGEDDLCESFFAYNRAKGTLYDGETCLFLRGSGKSVHVWSMSGLAEYCITPVNGLGALPDTLPYAESSVLGCAVFTAYGAIAHAAEVKPGNSVAVIGIGGVGSRAKAFRASVIVAVDVEDTKLETAKTFGATHSINSRKEDAIAKIKRGKAVMIGLSSTGGKGEVDITQLVRRKVLCCKWLVHVKMIGSYGGRAMTDLPKLVELAEQGIFNLEAAVRRRYKFEDVARAYQDLKNKFIVGRGVIEIIEMIGGPLPLFHLEALLINLCSGNWKRASIALRHLVKHLASRSMSELDHGAKTLSSIVSPVPLSDYLEGILPHHSSDKLLDWSTSQLQTGLFNFGSGDGYDAPNTTITLSSSRSEFDDFIESLERLHSYKHINIVEKMQVFALIDLLREVGTSPIWTFEVVDFEAADLRLGGARCRFFPASKSTTSKSATSKVQIGDLEIDGLESP